MKQPVWEKRALMYDPFAGDMGSPGDRTLKNKMVTVRKQGECHNCTELIEVGTRARVVTDIFDGDLGYHRFCELCCRAMAKSWEDGGEDICKRYELRYQLKEGK